LEIELIEESNGVSACASLLHVPKVEMDQVWSRPIKTLKPGGCTIHVLLD
jgi:hypothetical protein